MMQFERPLEGSKAFDITLTPDSGFLAEKQAVKVGRSQKQTEGGREGGSSPQTRALVPAWLSALIDQVEVRFVARSPGVAEELFGCRVSGMTHPLGFQLKAVAKAVVVAFQLLQPGQPLPR